MFDHPDSTLKSLYRRPREAVPPAPCCVTWPGYDGGLIRTISMLAPLSDWYLKPICHTRPLHFFIIPTYAFRRRNSSPNRVLPPIERASHIPNHIVAHRRHIPEIEHGWTGMVRKRSLNSSRECCKYDSHAKGRVWRDSDVSVDVGCEIQKHPLPKRHSPRPADPARFIHPEWPSAHSRAVDATRPDSLQLGGRVLSRNPMPPRG